MECVEIYHGSDASMLSILDAYSGMAESDLRTRSVVPADPTRACELRATAISFVFAKEIRANAIAKRNTPSAFDCPDGSLPSVTAAEYVFRFMRYIPGMREIGIVALALVDRFLTMDGVSLSEANVHRIWLSSAVVAHKFTEDHYYSGTYYAKIAGIGVGELNDLQLKFFAGIGYCANVTKDEYGEYERPIEILESTVRSRGNLGEYFANGGKL